MRDTVQLGNVEIAVTFKDVKNVHLSVHPPSGRVTLVAPTGTRLEVARAYAVSKLRWIRDQRARLLAQAREAPRQYVERESHDLWGRRHLLSATEKREKPSVEVDPRRILLTVRPDASLAKREQVMQAWRRSLLHEAVPPLIEKWEAQLGVTVSRYFLQRMKTKWGSCNHQARTIRLNTEPAKKPRDLLGYVVVHEMLHLIVPTHSEKFLTLMTEHYPAWREARAALNELPLGTVAWGV
jgi:predicted metal-dependent hydrolase